jgi:hypothetical protein
MASIPAQQAYNEIKAFVDEQGKPYKNWYAGIASDVSERLFGEHGVSEKNDQWIYRECQGEQSARNVEDGLLELGCDGDTGGSDQSTIYTYAYLKSANTKP